MKEKGFCLGTILLVLLALATAHPCPAQTMGDDLDIKPKSLAGCKSGAVLTATWDLPDGWEPGSPVNINITGIGGEDLPKEEFISSVSYEFKRHRGDYHLKLKYSCQEVLDIIKKHNLGGEVLITLSGYLYGNELDGEYVKGWDDIHVRRR
jgi:hypothetical protein